MGGLDTIFGGWLQFAAASLIVLAAQLVYVAFGFGAGLLAVGFLVLLLPGVQDAVVILLLVTLPVELITVWRARRLVAWRGVAAMAGAIAAGVVLGAVGLRGLAPSALLVVLGFMLVLSGAGFAATPAWTVVRPPRWAGPAVGLVSGGLFGALGVGGPPLVVYYRLQGLPKSAFRGQLLSLFLLVSLVRLPAYTAMNLVATPHLAAALALAPAVAAGAFLGERLHHRLDERAFRRLAGVLLVALGGVLLFKALAD